MGWELEINDGYGWKTIYDGSSCYACKVEATKFNNDLWDISSLSECPMFRVIYCGTVWSKTINNQSGRLSWVDFMEKVDGLTQ